MIIHRRFTYGWLVWIFLPGNLKKLQIDYCTLVPQQGGLTVEAETETVTIVNSAASKLFLGTEKGIFSRNYDDDANKWQGIFQGLTNLNIKVLADDGNYQIIAGTANGGIFRLINHGE